MATACAYFSGTPDLVDPQTLRIFLTRRRKIFFHLRCWGNCAPMTIIDTTLSSIQFTVDRYHNRRSRRNGNDRRQLDPRQRWRGQRRLASSNGCASSGTQN